VLPQTLHRRRAVPPNDMGITVMNINYRCYSARYKVLGYRAIQHPATSFQLERSLLYLSLQPEIPIQPPVSSQTATTLLHHQQDQPTSSASITADQMLENPQHPDLAERVFSIVFTFQSGFSCN